MWPAYTHILSAKFFSTSLLIVPFNYRCLLNPYFSQSSWQSIKQHWKRHDIAVCCLTSALTQSLESTLIDTVSLHDLYRLHPAVSGNFFSFTSLLIYQIHHEQEKRLGITVKPIVLKINKILFHTFLRVMLVCSTIFGFLGESNECLLVYISLKNFHNKNNNKQWSYCCLP